MDIDDVFKNKELGHDDRINKDFYQDNTVVFQLYKKKAEHLSLMN